MIITAGKYKGRKLNVPDESIARPTLSKVRMGVFNSLFSIMGSFEGKSFLDVFGGSGIMGLEALSRGFNEVKVFEKNFKAADIIRKNYTILGLKPDLQLGDSTKLITKLNKTYDVIYIDPPYMMENLYEIVLEKICNGIVIVEGIKIFESSNLEIIKSKNYGGKVVTFYRV